MHSEHWVEFLIWPRNRTMADSVHVRIRLKLPICLYDEAQFSGFVVARARARKMARRMLGVHPCTQMRAEPHDWSDSIDGYQKRTMMHAPRGVGRPEVRA